MQVLCQHYSWKSLLANPATRKLVAQFFCKFGNEKRLLGLY